MKHFRRLLALPVCGMLLCSCGTSGVAMMQTTQTPITEESSAAEPEIIRIEGEALFYAAAESVEELYDLAEVVLEFNSGEISTTAINDGVYTVITPQDVTVYKGDYDGSQLVAVGGAMNLKTYLDNVSALEQSYFETFTEERKENTVIESVTSGCILIESDTRYLFFGAKSDPERYGDMYSPVYTHQGYYVCDDSCIWLEQDMVGASMRDELTAAFAVPEQDTETQLAVDKESVLDAMMS